MGLGNEIRKICATWSFELRALRQDARPRSGLSDQSRFTRLFRRVVGRQVRKTTMHKHANYTLGRRRGLTTAMIESSNPARLGIEHRTHSLLARSPRRLIGHTKVPGNTIV
jgi:hypothetical protein